MPSRGTFGLGKAIGKLDALAFNHILDVPVLSARNGSLRLRLILRIGGTSSDENDDRDDNRRPDATYACRHVAGTA